MGKLARTTKLEKTRSFGMLRDGLPMKQSHRHVYSVLIHGRDLVPPVMARIEDRDRTMLNGRFSIRMSYVWLGRRHDASVQDKDDGPRTRNTVNRNVKV